MDDHRLVELTANLNMVAKRQLLLRFGFRRIEVIKAGFAHRDHALFCRQTAQRFNIVRFILIERMHTAGEDHFRAVAHQFTHMTVARQRRRDGQGKADVARGGFRHHVIHVFMQGLIIKAIEMAMRVD